MRKDQRASGRADRPPDAHGILGASETGTQPGRTRAPKKQEETVIEAFEREGAGIAAKE